MASWLHFSSSTMSACRVSMDQTNTTPRFSGSSAHAFAHALGYFIARRRGSLHAALFAQLQLCWAGAELGYDVERRLRLHSSDSRRGGAIAPAADLRHPDPDSRPMSVLSRGRLFMRAPMRSSGIMLTFCAGSRFIAAGRSFTVSVTVVW